MEDECLGGLDRHDRRGMRCPVEDRQLAEELAGTQDRHDRRLGALVARQDDLDRSARQDEQGVTRIALVEDRLAAPEPAHPQDADEHLDRLVVGRPEQAARPQGLADQPFADRHAGRSSGASHGSATQPRREAIVPVPRRITRQPVVSSARGHGSLPIVRRGDPGQVPAVRVLRHAAPGDEPDPGCTGSRGRRGRGRPAVDGGRGRRVGRPAAVRGPQVRDPRLHRPQGLDGPDGLDRRRGDERDQGSLLPDDGRRDRTARR